MQARNFYRAKHGTFKEIRSDTSQKFFCSRFLLWSLRPNKGSIFAIIFFFRCFWYRQHAENLMSFPEMNSTINLMHSPRFKLSKASSKTAIKFPSTFYGDRLLSIRFTLVNCNRIQEVFSRTDPGIEDGEVVDRKSAHKLCSSHRKLGLQLSGIKIVPPPSTRQSGSRGNCFRIKVFPDYSHTAKRRLR